MRHVHPSWETMCFGWIIHLCLHCLSRLKPFLWWQMGKERGALFQSVGITPGTNTLNEQISVDFTCTGSSSQHRGHKCQCSDSYWALLSALICYPQATLSWWKWLIFPVLCPSDVPSESLEFTERGKGILGSQVFDFLEARGITIRIYKIRNTSNGGLDYKSTGQEYIGGKYRVKRFPLQQER